MIEWDTTGRGFSYAEFKDRYDAECSIQMSSLASEDAIWLGVNDAKPQRLVPGKGWESVTLPEGTHTSTRMHLTREQVAELLPVLQRFVETGELTPPHALLQLAQEGE